MPDYIIFDKLNGKPRQSVSCDSGQIFSQLLENNDSFIEVETFYNITEIWIAGEEIKFIPPKPDNYSEFNWQTKQWDALADWLDKAKADAVKQINHLASQKILSKYPIYKQLNIARTDDAQVMYSWIDNIRNLSNIANANIETSTTLEQINSIVDNFKTELGNIA